MTPREIELRYLFKHDFELYAQNCLKIRSKNGVIAPFSLNKSQLYIHKMLEKQLKDTGKVRALILKGRQQGCSTYVEGRFYWKVTHTRGSRAFILTHDQEATNNLFEMVQRYHNNCLSFLQPVAGSHNAKELEFTELDSGYKVGTAGNKAVGRSSTIQFFHGSEVSFWPNAEEHAKGILQAIPDITQTEIILESTANGLGNYFSQQWQLAESNQSEYLAIFVPWFWQDEYQTPLLPDFKLTDAETDLKHTYELTNEQMQWRRKKIIELSVSGGDGEKAFKQEYPCCAAEAFQTTSTDSFISPDLVMKARKGKAEAVGPKLIGVDPARFGADRTSIIMRQGRVAYNLSSYSKLDTMQVVGLVNKLIKNEQPDKVFIDIGGLGAGIVDRLREMGYGNIVAGINAGSRPLDAAIYYNSRAEMWGEMKKWLQDEPVQIPDCDSLHADLCALSYKFDSNTRLQIERKEDVKKRGLRSPDEADALALTFAFPVRHAIDIQMFVNPAIRI